MRQFWAMVLQHLEVPGASINLAATVVEEEPEGRSSAPSIGIVGPASFE
jgi:hypothetical protein